MLDINFQRDGWPSDETRISRVVDGRRIVPAHQEIYNCMDDAFKKIFYIHYMWSNVSCIRVRKGRLGQAFKYLAGEGSFVSPFGAELILRQKLIDPTAERDVSFDTKRSNDGFAGFFIYLGTNNCIQFLSRPSATTVEPAPVVVEDEPSTFTNNPLREELIKSLNIIENHINGEANG